MGRPSLAEQRRVEICRALQSCVIRNGSYEMTSVKDIAQEAGMAAGMLHHYFESKDDILLVTAEMVLLELQNHLSDLLRIKDAAEREKMLEELLGDNEQNRFYIMLQAMALAMPAVNELLLGKQEEMRDILAERLEFRGSDPEKAKADADRMTFLLCSAVHLHLQACGRDTIIIVQTMSMQGATNSSFGIGQSIAFTFGGNVVHVFDPETGKNLEF